MESAIDILTRFEENDDWLIVHYDELKNVYDNQWVAVLRNSVIDHDADYKQLKKRLRQQYSQEYNEIATEYLTSQELDRLL
jgi:hypothetical protein